MLPMVAAGALLWILHSSAATMHAQGMSVRRQASAALDVASESPLVGGSASLLRPTAGQTYQYVSRIGALVAAEAFLPRQSPPRLAPRVSPMFKFRGSFPPPHVVPSYIRHK